MKKFVKRILALSICSALIGTSVHASPYEVIDKGAVDTHKFTFGIQENNTGESVVSATGAFNFSVQYEFLDEDDFDTIVLTAALSHEFTVNYDDIEDEAALRAGNPKENDSFWALSYLRSLDSNLTYQQYEDVAVLLNDNGVSEEVVIFDTDFTGTPTDDSTELTRSTRDTINGITNRSWIYGSASAPYLPVELVNDQDTDDVSDDTSINYWVREFITRGYYSIDRGETIIPLIAPESTYGGVSVVSDISESGIAIGYASTSISEAANTIIEDNCSTEEQLENTPFIVCLDIVLNSLGTSLNSIYTTEAFKWTINDNGEIEQTETLGQLVTPHVDDTRQFESRAQAINDSGTVVGVSHGWQFNDVTDPDELERRNIFAVVFENGTAIDLNTDHETYFTSTATGINNNNIAIGALVTTINGSARNVFFHADVSDTNNIELVMPDSFFVGSSTTPNSINEAGTIVGIAEVETSITTDGSSRRTHGFIYDINTEVFADLNDYLPCDSPYTIIEAHTINDNNDISATALISANAKDFFGTDLLDTDGAPIIEEVVRAVTLEFNPDGQIEECTAEEQGLIERQGASFGFLMPFVLLMIGFRRKFK